MMYRHKKMTKGMDTIYIYKYDGDDFMADGPMYEALIPDTAKEQNYYSLINGKRAFLYLLSDFGIDPIVYPDKEKLLEAGLIHPPYETRITDLQFINYFRFSESQSIEARTDIFIDALKGPKNFLAGKSS